MALIDVWEEDIATGHEPFARIMAAVQALASDEDLELVVSFEPAPLYEAMAQRGYTHESEQGADEVWRGTFWRRT